MKMNMNYIFLFLCFPLISFISLNAMMQKVENSEKSNYEALAFTLVKRQKPSEFSYFSESPQSYLACPHKKMGKDPSGFFFNQHLTSIESMEKKPQPLFFIGQDPLSAPRR